MEIERSRKTGSVRVATLLCGLCLSSDVASGAQNGVASDATCVELRTEAIAWADEIVLLPSEASTTQVAEAAIERWERCEEYAIAFPRFVIGSGHGRVVDIVIESRLPGAGDCGSFTGQTITIYRLVRTDNQRILSCPPPDRILAHELGHVLGLRDMDAQRGCPTFIMSEVAVGVPPLQRVARGECRAADRKWLTSSELEGNVAADQVRSASAQQPRSRDRRRKSQ
jgi:hypothetical protein